MKIIFLLMFMLTSFEILSQDISVEVNPPEPVVNDTFYLTFKIKSAGDVEPYITFTPNGATVLGKSEQGVSISTIVVNGKFTTTREQNYVYEMQATRSGTIFIKNIKVDIGNKINQLKDLNISVLSAPRRIPDVFMEAQVSKTKVYVGEGIDVNYYLYTKTSITANDVKEFPKLNKFIKRFKHNNSPPEVVQYKGEVLKRFLAYSARVYPEKPGVAIIDPMRMSVQVVEETIGAFGFGTQRVKNKDIATSKIEIEVLALPSENVPPGFTGLVGEHEFNLVPPKEKYLVNEPIEFKLEVKGKGALEKMEAPVLYQDQNLEQFDTKADISDTENVVLKKSFEYTMLPRNSLQIAPRVLELSYFNPEQSKYVVKKIELPGISVSGAAYQPPQADANQNDEKGKNVEVGSKLLNNFEFKMPSFFQIKSTGLVAPVFSQSSAKAFNNFLNTNLLLFILLIASGYIYYDKVFKGIQIVGKKKEAIVIYKEIKKSGISYSNYIKLLNLLLEQEGAKNKTSSELLKESNLSQEAKKYFLETINLVEKQHFSIDREAKPKIPLIDKYFKELLKKG